MRLNITGGFLEVELEKDAVQKIQDQLQKLGTEKDEETKQKIIDVGKGGKKKSIDGTEFMGELKDKSKLPI